MSCTQNVKVALLVILIMKVLSEVEGQKGNLPQVCDDKMYCQGELLHTIQLAGIYNDSKTFVDKKLKDRATVQTNFEQFMTEHNSTPSKAQVKKFVEDNFDPEGSEFEPWHPTDWKKKPQFINKIRDEKYQKWASHLNEKWKKLGRDILEAVEKKPELYSQIYVKYPVIVPGGRFREYYYWDSYWTIRGLLICEMKETVKGMLRNFKELVEKIGLIPNGGRVYYLRRSQPPLYIPMVQSYLDFTNDKSILGELMSSMEQEFDFWMKNRTVKFLKNNKEYTMAIYNTETAGPRPESYREDVTDAKAFDAEEEKLEFYNELKSAAESGWDFSSRWFMGVNGSMDNSLKLINIKVRSIIPVDLNAILCWNAEILGQLNDKLGKKDKAQKYKKIAGDFKAAINAVLRDEAAGIWFDYDYRNSKSRKEFYPSNFAPLWTMCYDQAKKNQVGKKAVSYLKKMVVKEKNVGGIPSSLITSGEQWDYPNVWPPLQHMIVVGLEQTGNQEAKDEAFFWVERWVKSVHAAFEGSGNMYEKYSSEKFGEYGHGGEYATQEGFGWTNAVILEFLSQYYSSQSPTEESGQTFLEPGVICIILPFLGVFVNYLLNQIRNFAAKNK